MHVTTMASRTAVAFAALAALGACQVVPQNGASPAPTSTPAPSPAPVASAPPVAPLSNQSALNWEVAPVEPGIWAYRVEGADRVATFGPAGAQPHLAFACSTANRQITVRLAATGSAARTLTIRTTYGALQWPITSAAALGGAFVATRAATETGFDWIAYSRGRIAIELDGRSHFIAPSASEIGRVIEDCRS